MNFTDTKCAKLRFSKTEALFYVNIYYVETDRVRKYSTKSVRDNVMLFSTKTVKDCEKIYNR